MLAPLANRLIFGYKSLSLIIACRKTLPLVRELYTRRKSSLKAFYKINFLWQLLLPLTLLTCSVVNASHSAPLFKSFVNSIAQDENGFIWFGSMEGLTRFNGKNTITFNSQDPLWKTKFSWAHDVYPTKNNLLIGTENNGLWLFNPHISKAKKIETSVDELAIYKVVEFNNQYYFHTRSPSNLYRFNPQTQITHLIARDVDLTAFLLTEQQLYFYNRTGVFTIENQGIAPIIDKKIDAALIQEDQLILADKNTLYAYHQQSLPSENTNKQEPSYSFVERAKVTTPFKVTAIATEFSSSHFYIASQSGEISKYSLKLEELPHPYQLNENLRVQSLYHDSSKVLWINSTQGTRQLSPIYVKNHQQTFNTYISRTQLATIDNELVIGSYGAGLQPFRQSSSLSSQVTVQPTNFSKINQLFTKRAVIITDILTVSDDTYISTFDGLWLYQHQTEQLRKIALDSVTNKNKTLSKDIKILLNLYRDKNILYISTDNDGFISYDLTTHKVIKHFDDSYKLSSTEVLSVLATDEDTLWVATAKGLDVLNIATNTINNINLPGENKATSLTFFDNKIFLATMGDGIFVYNQQQNLLAHFGKGITFSQIKTINDEIWAPAQKGLYRISPNDYQISMVENSEQYSFTSEAVLFNNSGYYSAG
jgi:AraC family chitin signaling transcriptional activator